MEILSAFLDLVSCILTDTAKPTSKLTYFYTGTQCFLCQHFTLSFQYCCRGFFSSLSVFHDLNRYPFS